MHERVSQPAAWIAVLLVRELEGFERELALVSDDAILWQTAPGVSNSMGNLTLHVCGNLQHFVGRVLGGTGYIRDREREFGARDVPRRELATALGRTQDVVRAVVPALSDEQLAATYPETIAGVSTSTGQFLTHLVAHLAFHLGQVGYLRRFLAGVNLSAGPLPLTPLALHG
jgi:uncharacterized damage-inducible protein DinB